MNNFEPGINPVGYGSAIQGTNNSPLLSMLQQLFQQRLHPQMKEFGVNGAPAPGGDPMNGYYDTIGNFKTGLPPM